MVLNFFFIFKAMLYFSISCGGCEEKHQMHSNGWIAIL